MSTLLDIRNLTRDFRLGSSTVTALDNVSLTLNAGEILGIVGESGSGKSTLAQIVMALDLPTSGTVVLDQQDLFDLNPRALRKARRDFQMVFQDPYGSLNPRHRVGRIIAEPLHLIADAPKGQQRRAMVGALLADVGLDPEDQDRFPHEFSGGQRQRIAIARALITKPRLLVADEATSALDLTVQRQILDLILDLRRKHGIAVLFITHNIGVVQDICDTVAVMQNGKLVEVGPAKAVLDAPSQIYTQRLLAAEPRLDVIGRKARHRS